MERVQVFLRLKQETNTVSSISVCGNSVVDGKTVYEFDGVFVGKEQAPLYKQISTLVETAKRGEKLTVFAYGQTGSGKTYTMEGTEKNPGIIPRVIHDLFNGEKKRTVISMAEIYNEKVSDMINPENPVAIRENKTGEITDTLSKMECTTEEEALSLFRQGAKNRRTDSNAANLSSSRSHLIFTVETETFCEKEIITSKIILVDLAGSERMEIETEKIHSVKRHKVERNLETSSINKSLLYLSRVIHILSQRQEQNQEKKSGYINYRDSKLTFFLRDSLNGLSMLAIIGAVNAENETETRNTLKFLSTAKEIRLTTTDTPEKDKSIQRLISQMEYLAKENKALKVSVSQLAQRHPLTKQIQTVNKLIEETECLISRTQTLSKMVETADTIFINAKKDAHLLQSQLFHSLRAAREREIDSIQMDNHLLNNIS